MAASVGSSMGSMAAQAIGSANNMRAGTVGAAVTVVDEHGKRSRASSDQATEQAELTDGRLDPITYEVIRNRLWAINDEQAQTAARKSGTARKTTARR